MPQNLSLKENIQVKLYKNRASNRQKSDIPVSFIFAKYLQLIYFSLCNIPSGNIFKLVNGPSCHHSSVKTLKNPPHSYLDHVQGALV